MRESLERGSRHVSVGVYPMMGNWTARRRAATMGPSTMLSGNWRVNWPAGTALPNAWLRLQRAVTPSPPSGASMARSGRRWRCLHSRGANSPTRFRFGLGTTSHGEQEPASPMVEVRYEQSAILRFTNASVDFYRSPHRHHCAPKTTSSRSRLRHRSRAPPRSICPYSRLKKMMRPYPVRGDRPMSPGLSTLANDRRALSAPRVSARRLHGAQQGGGPWSSSATWRRPPFVACGIGSRSNRGTLRRSAESERVQPGPLQPQRGRGGHRDKN